ncbi:phosphate starvation-inducible membrane PsiE [Geomicrobium halophilum]|uniref:Phosphate starvation-inducible membrane PsiE n=1 Tax=Geomicrobium halophilum TaxID=549000 RepID=A0A841PI56_9BACL|nr:hypothetical protein [Geomicrobium halophilum]MBB6448470.1 phosphate starvation-inducible membrane PsiE [Geomicrobium halophilum]
MIARMLTIFLAAALALLILFEHRTGTSTGFLPHMILLLLVPLFVYDFWRRRKERSKS